MLFKDFGTDAQNEFADLKLGLTEQIRLCLADQQSGQRGDLLIDDEANLGFKLFGFLFLFLGEMVPDHGVSFGAISREIKKHAASVQKFYQLFSCSHLAEDSGNTLLTSPIRYVIDD